MDFVLIATEMKKEIIERIRKEANGFTQKDLIYYLVDRIDKVYDKLEKGEGKIASNRLAIVEIKTGIKILKWVGGILFSAVGLYITYWGALK